VNTVALSEIVEFTSGGTPSKANPTFWDGDVPWFSAKDIKKPRLTDSADHICESVFTATSLRRVPANTVVLVVRGMILAHTVPIAVLAVEAAINQDLKALLPKQDVDSTFLAAMLRAQHSTILSQVSTAGHGTKKLDSRVLESIRIPLPELDEQRRIAAVLDLAAGQRTAIESMLGLQDELIGSLQARAFRGEL
jgi:type I restriction enzyme S subunit